MRETLTSYDDATAGQGTVVNDVQFAYNDFGQLTTEYQEHGGAVDTSTSPKVQYSYADGTDNHIRPTSLTYPDGRVIDYDYGASGGMDDAASRVQAIKDGTLALAEYSYLGQATFVEVDYTEPDVKYTLIDLNGNDDPDTGDIYSGLDRFGRVKDNRWRNYGSAADVDRIKYGYDRAGNRLWRENLVADNHGGGFDELYTYDGSHRLADMQRGDLNANKDGINNKAFAEDWALDPTGNWAGYKKDDDGDGTWDLDQDRTANAVNEITDITESAGSSWATPGYDRAGNMTTIPQPADPTVTFSGTYDAWNRLVTLVDDGTSNTVQENEYDGARRRIVRKDYSSGTLDETRHFFYAEPQRWQVVEERVGTSSDPDRQFVWGERYVDGLVLRDRDTDANGILDERLYGLQDANWNVAAVVDDAGGVQERYTYQANGTPQVLTPAFASRSTSSFEWGYLFTSRVMDLETSLYYYRARYLSPSIGFFLSRDPIATNLNAYSYGNSNPLRFLDPTGLFAEDEEDDTPVSDLIDLLDKLKTPKDWWDAIKNNKIPSPLGVLSGCLQGQIQKYIKALEQFSPNSSCGKWYKATYLAILKAGTKCDKKHCTPIDNGINGSKNTPAGNCYFDILFSGGSGAAGNFRKFAQSLAKKCGKLPRTSKHCTGECDCHEKD